MAGDRSLPTGTVTFLFTDVEGSTGLLERLGSRYEALLSEHHQALREVFERCGGVEVDTQGDAFFVAFASANDAVQAAAEIQRALADGELRVRVGLHSGEAAVGELGYVGIDVHRAARIAAAAHGGQILASQATRELAEPQLADDLSFRDLGEHRLKDLTRPQRLHQLVVAGLPAEFPPLRTLADKPTNLPVLPTALIGRRRELEQTRQLLSGSRLLTLTGAGGTGKTRLALQLAADVLDEFEGVYVVDLASVDEPSLVLPAVAQTLGLKEGAGRSSEDVLAERFQEGPVLLVLDNFEHVVDAATDLAGLLRSASGLKVIATSRTPLRVSAEQEYAVPPLDESAAVALFEDRARAVKAGFSLDGDRDVAVEICRRLDDLPLAIELAAARVKLLPPRKLLERLERRLPLLTGGARDAPTRQQTLAATIDWSVDLLDEREQQVFFRLSVFEGGCTLEAAEAVCDATLDDLASLVDKSLLVEREGRTGEPRFHMLEVVREYARERLEASAAADMRGRHAEYFLELVENADDPSTHLRVVDRVEDEVDNLAAARAWFVDSRDAEREVRLLVAGYESLWTRGYTSLFRQWLASASERAGRVDRALQADVLAAAAFTAAHHADADESVRLARESAAISRELGDKKRLEWALRVESFYAQTPSERLQLLRECERLLRELGDDHGLAWIAYNLGDVATSDGHFPEAGRQLEEAIHAFTRLGRRWEANNARITLGLVRYREGRLSDAEALLQESLRQAVEFGSSMSVSESLVLLAALRLDAGDAEGATRLVAYSRAIQQEASQTLDPKQFGPIADRVEQAARDELGDRFHAAWDEGTALELDEAVALALER